MKLIDILRIVLLTSPLAVLLPGPTTAAEYVFRDLMADTIPAPKCENRDEAATRASEKYTVDKFKKRFCETQGYGWTLVESKNDGKLVCNECGNGSENGRYQCHVADIVVTCKRLKPGSVGMFPGKG